MTTDGALELFRNAVLIAMQLAGPVVMAALVMGLIIGVLQTITQVNEPSIAFVMKLLAVCVTFAALGPYMMKTTVDYTRRTIASISEVVK